MCCTCPVGQVYSPICGRTELVFARFPAEQLSCTGGRPKRIQLAMSPIYGRNLGICNDCMDGTHFRMSCCSFSIEVLVCGRMFRGMWGRSIPVYKKHFGYFRIWCFSCTRFWHFAACARALLRMRMIGITKEVLQVTVSPFFRPLPSVSLSI